MRPNVFLLCFVTLLPGCATIIEGKTDTVTVSTDPAGATCTIDRAGERIGAVSATPGSVTLDKSKNSLLVTCSKAGFDTATVTADPSFTGTTFANILLGGVIGIVVDAASGADNKYPPSISMNLAVQQQTPPMGPVVTIPDMTSSDIVAATKLVGPGI